jgi:hypothetical protein
MRLRALKTMWFLNRIPALALVTASIAWGQIGGGSMVGTVKDPSGAPVVGVKVQAHHEETNEERLVTTNEEGYYEFPLLAPGHYRLQAEAPGSENVNFGKSLSPRASRAYQLALKYVF